MPSILNSGNYDFALQNSAVNSGNPVKFTLDYAAVLPCVEKRRNLTEQVPTSSGNRLIVNGRSPLMWTLVANLQSDHIRDNQFQVKQNPQTLRMYLQAFEQQNGMSLITLYLPYDSSSDRTFTVLFEATTEFVSLQGLPLVRATIHLVQAT